MFWMEILVKEIKTFELNFNNEIDEYKQQVLEILHKQSSELRHKLICSQKKLPCKFSVSTANLVEEICCVKTAKKKFESRDETYLKGRFGISSLPIIWTTTK